MKLLPITGSSHIIAGGFEGDKLHIEYKDGSVYEFQNQHPDRFTELMQAESKGKFLRTLGVKGVKIR